MPIINDKSKSPYQNTSSGSLSRHPRLDRGSPRHARPDWASRQITDKKQGPPFDDPITPLTTWLTSFCKGNQIKQKSKGHTASPAYGLSNYECAAIQTKKYYIVSRSDL